MYKGVFELKNKKMRKSKALKNDGVKNVGFFKAFFTCVVVSIVTIPLFCAVVSAVMNGQSDSTKNMSLISNVVFALCLVIGGFVGGKMSGEKAFASAFAGGCAVLGIFYALSRVLNLNGEMAAAGKTLRTAMALLCPVIGAKMGVKPRGTSKKKR